jgi:hypothetical protein
VLRDGRLKLHKSKRNSNGTFSIGKTWALEELQMLHVSDASLCASSGRKALLTSSAAHVICHHAVATTLPVEHRAGPSPLRFRSR